MRRFRRDLHVSLLKLRVEYIDVHYILSYFWALKYFKVKIIEKLCKGLKSKQKSGTAGCDQVRRSPDSLHKRKRL